MNRKIFTLLIVLFAIVSIASVCAVELNETYDFDNLFQLKVVEGDNFTLIGDPQDYSSLLHSKLAYKNDNESIIVLCYDDDMETSLMYLTEGDIDPGNGVANVDFSEEGDLILLNKTSKMDISLEDYNITTFAGISFDNDTPDDSNDDLTVFIGGDNETLVKECANSIKFE